MTIDYKYDLFIPVAKKDYNKVYFAIKCAVKFLNPKPENIFVVSPTKFCDNVLIENYSIKNFQDEEVLQLDLNKILYRPTWIKQQLIKLLQNVTINNKYLLIDSDFFLTSGIDLELDKNTFFLSIDQNHKPYFDFQEKFFGFGRVLNYSFTSEIMLFDKSIINKLFFDKNMTKQDFINYCYNNINNSSYLNEQEFYGSYIYKTFSNVKLKKINTVRHGKQCLPDEIVWQEEEIEKLINLAIEKKLHAIGLHSWL